MKNHKILLAFAAGVVTAVFLLPSLHGFHLAWFNQLNDWLEATCGGLFFFTILFIVAYAARRKPGPNEDSSIPAPYRITCLFHSLRASRTDRWLGGICGGLGQSTTIPSWVWRIGFVVGTLVLGAGVILYLLLWLFMPVGDAGQEREPNLERFDFNHFWRNYRKSQTDCHIGGVCGGLGEHTPLPSWVWRFSFTFFAICSAPGIIVLYLLLWIFAPPAQDVKNQFTS